MFSLQLTYCFRYNNTISKKVLAFLLFLSVAFSFLLAWKYLLSDNLRSRILLYSLKNNSHQRNRQRYRYNISCHYIDVSEALLPIETNSSIPFESIFFHETSCRGHLNSRQACSVESAARAHPHRQINVLFSGPVTNKNLNIIRSFNALKQFTNVKFFRLHLLQYIKGTAVEYFVSRGALELSPWPIEHTSDILRYLTLYKWGGVYLDTDMLVVKPLTSLGHNWVAKEENDVLNAAAIAISMDEQGRKLAEALMNEVRTTFNPYSWVDNGPGVITRVFHKTCNTSNVLEWSYNTCQGVEVYGQKYFFPLHYSRGKEYFKTGELKNVENAYTHHFWNQLTQDMNIEKDSPYEKMAQRFCPTIYKMYGNDFGT